MFEFTVRTHVLMCVAEIRMITRAICLALSLCVIVSVKFSVLKRSVDSLLYLSHILYLSQLAGGAYLLPRSIRYPVVAVVLVALLDLSEES